MHCFKVLFQQDNYCKRMRLKQNKFHKQHHIICMIMFPNLHKIHQCSYLRTKKITKRMKNDNQYTMQPNFNTFYMQNYIVSKCLQLNNNLNCKIIHSDYFLNIMCQSKKNIDFHINQNMFNMKDYNLYKFDEQHLNKLSLDKMVHINNYVNKLYYSKINSQHQNHQNISSISYHNQYIIIKINQQIKKYNKSPNMHFHSKNS